LRKRFGGAHHTPICSISIRSGKILLPQKAATRWPSTFAAAKHSLKEKFQEFSYFENIQVSFDRYLRKKNIFLQKSCLKYS
jgi:hypothetical protein